MNQEIYILKSDKEKLLDIIDKASTQDYRTSSNQKELEKEIIRARVVEQEKLPYSFIKMNSRVLMTVDQEEEEIMLVYPEEADIKKNKISVFSPIGTAILGYCAGNSIEWKVPDGTVQIQIIDIRD